MTGIPSGSGDNGHAGQQVEPIEDSRRAAGTRRWLRVTMIGIALALAPSGVAIAHDCEEAIQAATEEARGWPNYDPTRAIDQAEAIEAATVEGQGWPDFDPTRAADDARVEAAIEEAQAWPNFDPTRAIDQANAIEAAAVEAQGWPDYDATRSIPQGPAIEVASDPATGSPRLSQIAASEAEAADLIGGNPHAF